MPNAAAAAMTLSFTLSSTSASPSTRCAPRAGTLISRRADSEKEIVIETPNLMTTTSRGVVPHLSRDHHRGSAAIKWVNVPFETFLEQNPPLPILQPGPTPLHTLLGFTPSTHLLSLSARDPSSAHDMPPNSNTHISVSSLRGVRKLTADAWREYCEKTKPDVVFALSDTPYTDPPYSQKRTTKSIERSAAWLANLLRTGPAPPSSTATISSRSSKKVKQPASLPAPPPSEPSIVPAEDPAPSAPLPPIFVHLAGGTSPAARKAFAASLTEQLYGPEAAAVAPLSTLDAGVSGYVVDLVPLKLELSAASRKAAALAAPASNPPAPSELESQSQSAAEEPTAEEHITALVHPTLTSLPASKPLLITSAQSPHEILHYITHLGADMFDAQWAQRAADIGVALDFEFPVRAADGEGESGGRAEGAKRQIGHNLYEKRYALDFSPFADAFRGAYVAPPSPSSSSSSSSPSTPSATASTRPICPCVACSPIVPAPHERLYHGADTPAFSHPASASSTSSSTPSRIPATPSAEHNTPNTNTTSSAQTYRPAHTRAYAHHLLHTHEMGAHALLALHNLAVVDAFLAGVRGVLLASSSSSASSANPTSSWTREVSRFTHTYAVPEALFDGAERRWREVDRARGKGRLAREREREEGEKEKENDVQGEARVGEEEEKEEEKEGGVEGKRALEESCA